MSKQKTPNIIELRKDHAAIICEHKGATREVLIDLADVDRVRQHRWSIGSNPRPGGRDYLFVQTSAWTPGIGQRTIRLARFLLEVDDGVQVDHQNRDPLDCRRHNMRAATHLENAQNLSPVGRGASRKRGVTPAQSGKFRARVALNRTLHHLGYFATADEAARVAAAFRAQNMPFSEEARNAKA